MSPTADAHSLINQQSAFTFIPTTFQLDHFLTGFFTFKCFFFLYYRSPIWTARRSQLWPLPCFLDMFIAGCVFLRHICLKAARPQRDLSRFLQADFPPLTQVRRKKGKPAARATQTGTEWTYVLRVTAISQSSASGFLHTTAASSACWGVEFTVRGGIYQKLITLFPAILTIFNLL